MTTVLTALVLGGTGHLGHAVLRELLSRRYRVKVLTRQTRPSILEGLDISVVHTDAGTADAVERSIDGADVVVDAAAPYPLHLTAGRREPNPVRDAIVRTRRIAETARRHNAALVFISSFTTLARPAGILSEIGAQMRRALHPYFVAKQAMEEAVVAACRQGLRGVIVNPTACLGPWDTKPRSLCALPLLLSGQLPATSPRMVNVIDVRDVGRGAVAALEAGVFARPVLLAGHDIRADKLALRACAIAGVKPPLFRTSARAVATAAYWTEWWFEATGRRAPFPSLPALLLCEARATGIGEVQRALGILPRPLDNTLIDAIDWYRALGYLAPC